MSTNLVKNRDFDVLIVEDEPILAMAMEVKLKKIGLNISGISSCPNSAMVHVQNHYPDIAIIDINLNATKTGIDVANYIWKNFQIPIIFLTSYYNDNILKQAMEAEPYAYLLKPCRDEDLKVAINTAMHKHHFFFKNKKILNPATSKFIYIDKNIKFDRTNLELYMDDRLFKLTKNEKKLFEILAKDAGSIVGFNTIFNFIWREDVYDLSKLRSLIYRLKNKLGFNPFENLYEEGYKIKIFKK
jgi:DNA-binding response OmpR family regulator